jgi:hypothetical protein
LNSSSPSCPLTYGNEPNCNTAANSPHLAILFIRSQNIPLFPTALRIGNSGISLHSQSRRTSVLHSYVAPVCQMPPPSLNRRGFEIAIICALPLEADCVQCVFDKFWKDESEKYGKEQGDPNAYTTGVIGDHDVVLAHMPGMGKASASGVAASLLISFPRVKLALVVRICGGVPYQ